MPKDKIVMKYNPDGSRQAGYQGIEKSSSEGMNVSRLPLGPKGYSGLNVINDRIYEESRRALRFPESIRTFKKMAQDSTVAAPLNFIDIVIGRVQWEFKVDDDASEEAKAAAKFLNWNKDNMTGQTWKEAINEIGSYRTFGFHVAEKLYKQVPSGEYAGKLKLSKLATRSQDTICGWEWNKNGANLTAVKQDTSRLNNYGGSRVFNVGDGKTERVIPREKFLLFRYDPKRDNPEGRSPLVSCWTSYEQKLFCEEQELIGLGRDLAGTPVLGIDHTFLSRAEDNPEGAEAQAIAAMEKNAVALHAGDQGVVFKPLAYDDKGNPLFTFELIGVNGGGKMFDTQAIIQRKQNEILTSFLADVLKLGQDGKGSFALSDNKSTQLEMAVEHHLGIIKDQFDNDLIPQLLALNGWFLPEEDMPKAVFGDIAEKDLNALGQYVQRTVAVGALTADKELDKFLRTSAKMPLNSYEDDNVIPEKFTAKGTSRSGDGMESGLSNGTGGGVGEDASTANTSNGPVAKATLGEASDND